MYGVAVWAYESVEHMESVILIDVMPIMRRILFAFDA